MTNSTHATCTAVQAGMKRDSDYRPTFPLCSYSPGRSCTFATSKKGRFLKLGLTNATDYVSTMNKHTPRTTQYLFYFWIEAVPIGRFTWPDSCLICSHGAKDGSSFGASMCLRPDITVGFRSSGFKWRRTTGCILDSCQAR
jgi:hypothetical protein